MQENYDTFKCFVMEMKVSLLRDQVWRIRESTFRDKKKLFATLYETLKSQEQTCRTKVLTQSMIQINRSTSLIALFVYMCLTCKFTCDTTDFAYICNPEKSSMANTCKLHHNYVCHVKTFYEVT